MRTIISHNSDSNRYQVWLVERGLTFEYRTRADAERLVRAINRPTNARYGGLDVTA